MEIGGGLLLYLFYPLSSKSTMTNPEFERSPVHLMPFINKYNTKLNSAYPATLGVLDEMGFRK